MATVTFPDLVAAELARARTLHPQPHHTLEESYAIILEEIDEFWDLVKDKPQYQVKCRLRAELVQVAAMCQRAAEDLRIEGYEDFWVRVESCITRRHHSWHDSYGLLARHTNRMLNELGNGDWVAMDNVKSSLVCIAANAWRATQDLGQRPYREDCTQ